MRSWLNVDKLTLDETKTALSKLDAAALRAMVDIGCKAVTVVQREKDMLFIPPGWLVAQVVTKGVLVYGLRKACVYTDEAAYANFETVLGLYQDNKKAGEEMRKALTYMGSDSV